MSVRELTVRTTDITGIAAIQTDHGRPALHVGRRSAALQLFQVEGAVEPVRSGDTEISPVAEVRDREATYRRLLMCADACAATGVLVTVAALSGQSLRWCFCFPALFAIVVAKIQGLYDRDDVVIYKSSLAEWRTVFQSAAITSVGIYLGWRLLTTARSSGGLRQLAALTVGICVTDLLARAVARRVARAVTPADRVVIIGDPRQCMPLARTLSDLPGVDLIGTIPAEGLGGSPDELSDVVDHLHTHRLVIVPNHRHPESFTLDLIRSAKSLGVRVTLMPTIMAVVGSRAVFDEVHGLVLLGVPRFGLSRSSWAVKRSFDLVGAVLGTILAAPLLVLLAVLIKLDSPGPVLFRQTRVGRNGREFKIFKLRTMVDGADAMKAQLLRRNEASEGLFKMVDDPRVTRVGRRLRQLHLDELPQLINVLRGDMSLVGPRPLVTEEDAQLAASCPQRLPLTPGITGPWQIRGPMNASLAEMARLDYLYISSWSIWRDIDILIRTAQKVMARGGQ
jgi:exopolysaccharide biosynthesis polyprenyl glycosylphosphotransferase